MEQNLGAVRESELAIAKDLRVVVVVVVGLLSLEVVLAVRPQRLHNADAPEAVEALWAAGGDLVGGVGQESGVFRWDYTAVLIPDAEIVKGGQREKCILDNTFKAPGPLPAGTRRDACPASWADHTAASYSLESAMEQATAQT